MKRTELKTKLREIKMIIEWQIQILIEKKNNNKQTLELLLYILMGS